MKNKQMQAKNKNYCFDCQKPKIFHFSTWFDDLISILPVINFSPQISKLLDLVVEKIFCFLGLLKYKPLNDSSNLNIPLRTKLFISEAQKQGIKFWMGFSPFGLTNYFLAEVDFKKIKFFGFPVAEFLNSKISLIDNKIYVKKILKQNNFPVAEGKKFWFFQIRPALKYTESIGYPVVVKPNNGSFAQHVKTNILNKNDLILAIQKVKEYSPSFLIEKFIENSFVFRITVIDFQYVFCVKQVPANVLGDGKSSIRELIDKKNKDRGELQTGNKNAVLYKILENETTEKLLKSYDYDYSFVPPQGQIVYLQKDPFLRLGGDLIEETEKINEENKKMFLDIARLFNIRVVGIDFVAQDISLPFYEQKCSVLELNSSPCIELHMFPSAGQPKNLAYYMVNFFKKYYL